MYRRVRCCEGHFWVEPPCVQSAVDGALSRSWPEITFEQRRVGNRRQPNRPQPTRAHTLALALQPPSSFLITTGLNQNAFGRDKGACSAFGGRLALCLRSETVGESHQSDGPRTGAFRLSKFLRLPLIPLTHWQQTVIHYGWIPFIIYVGYTRSNPQPSLIKYVSTSLRLLPEAPTTHESTRRRLISPLA